MFTVYIYRSSLAKYCVWSIVVNVYMMCIIIIIIRHELSVPREHCIINYLSSSKVIHNIIDCK